MAGIEGLMPYIISAILIVLSGIFSGINLGFMSLSKNDLLRKIKLGDKRAKKIYPLRKDGNLLLTTVLLGNVLVNSILAIFLGSITVGIVAVGLSTGLIVVFGEIVPQAFFSRHALNIGSKMTWLVWFFLIILYPVSKPIAMLLDKTLGEELSPIFTKKEIRLFLREQKKYKKTGLKELELKIMEGSLSLSSKKIEEIMTPRVKVFFLKENQVLNKNLLKKIHQNGFTRIPVFRESRDKIIGILYVKDLIHLNYEKKIVVKDIMRKKFYELNEADPIEKVIYEAKEKENHLFIVKGKYGGVAGIVTLEDTLEEMVGEIIDEYDVAENLKNPSEIRSRVK